MTEETTRKKWTPQEYKIVSTLFGVNLICAMLSSLLAPIYPQQVFAINGTATDVGLVFGSYQVVNVLAAPVMGTWLAFCGLRTTFNVGTIVLTAGAVLFGFVIYIPKLPVFLGVSILLRIIQGIAHRVRVHYRKCTPTWIGAAGINVSTFTMASMQFPASQGFVIGLLETAFGAGCSIGPFVGSALYQMSGFTTAYVSFGAFQLLAGILANFLLFQKPSGGCLDEEAKPTVSIFSLFKILCTWTQFLHVLWVFIGSCNHGFVTSLLALRLDGFGVASIEIGTVFLVFGAIYAVSSVAVGYIGDKVGRADLIVLLTGILLITGCALLGPLPLLPITSSFWMTILAVVIMAVGIAGPVVLPVRLAIREIRKHDDDSNMDATSSLVVSMWIASVAFGGLVGPLIGGAVYDQAGFRVATLFPLTLNIILIATFCFYALFSSRSGKK